MSHVLAVDGGNSRSLAVVATVDGRVAGVGWGGCTDLESAASPGAALAELEAVCGEALAAAGVAGARVAASAFSLAGADWPEDFRLLRSEPAARLSLAAAPVVVNDAIGALRLGGEAWEGISVIYGSDNAVGARNAGGAVFHLAQWPDRTGMRSLAAEGLRTVYRDELDLGPATTLTARALDLYEVGDGIELLRALMGRDGLPPDAAERMAPVVLDEAAAGDPVALSLVRQAGHTLGCQARACAARVGLDVPDSQVVLVDASPQRRSRLLAEAVLTELPGARPAWPSGPPVVGPLLLAYDGLGVAVDPDALGASVLAAAGDAAALVHAG